MSGELIYCGYSGGTAWAFSTAEELGAWAAEHPEGTIDVIVQESAQPTTTYEQRALARERESRERERVMEERVRLEREERKRLMMEERDYNRPPKFPWQEKPTMSDWYRDTPEARRMLERERAKVAKAEARYECQRCGKALKPDYGLRDWQNRLRAWMWRQAHRLNCGCGGNQP